MKDFNNKVAVVTGAASGIGEALALELAKRGAHLALCDVDETGLAASALEAKRQGVEVTTAIVDVADKAAMASFAEQVVADHGRVNLVFNNAGVALSATVEGGTYEDVEWLMGINFWGVVYGTKEFLPYLEESGDGHVVNLSSVFGLLGIPSQSAYNAAKFAVRGFTEALRLELKMSDSSVSATSIHPGGIKTNIVRNARVDNSIESLGQDPDAAPEEFEKAFITTPKKAAKVILKAVEKDKPRAMVGPDGHALDLLARLPPRIYQALILRGAARGV